MKTLYLSGIVGYEITADSIRAQINEQSKEKLQVIVNSPGGFVIDAFEIYNIFNMYNGEIEFVINGMAASAMSYIIMSGDKISAFKNSIFMAHKAQTIAFGNSDEIQREADIARSMDNVLAESYVKRMKKPKAEILEAMKNEIWHIGWEALTEAGIIDNVIDSPDEIEIPDEDIKQQIIFADQPMDRSIVNLKIMETMNRMARDTDRMKSNSMKAAALLTNQTPIEKPVEDNIITEEKMNLQEFLSSNPEAKAEFDEALLSAEEKGKESVRAEYSNDRTRIANILKAGGISVTDSIVEAIDKGVDAGEFALAEIERQKNLKPDASKSPFASIVAKQTPAEQSPEEAENQFDIEKVKNNVQNVMKQIGGI